MPIEPVRFPGPRGVLPGRQVVPVEQSVTPPVQVQVQLPPSPAPFSKRVLDEPLRSTESKETELVDWGFAGPLVVRVENGLDADARAALHLSMDRNRATPLKDPVLEFDIGRGEAIFRTIDPAHGDSWAPWAWAIVQALSKPTNGNLVVEFARVGGL